MANKRAFNLDPQTTKDLTAVYPVDKSIFAEQKYITGNILRTRAAVTQNETGSAITLDYTNVESILLTISQPVTITITNTPANSTCTLRIVKGVLDTVTFAGSAYEEKGRVLGLTSLMYSFVKHANVQHIKRDDVQTTLQNNSSVLSSSHGTITSGGYFNFYINGNVATLAASFTFTKSGSDSSTATITFAKLFDFLHDFTSLSIRTNITGLHAQGQISEGGMNLAFNTDLIAGSAYNLLISASIILE